MQRKQVQIESEIIYISYDMHSRKTNTNQLPHRRNSNTCSIICIRFSMLFVWRVMCNALAAVNGKKRNIYIDVYMPREINAMRDGNYIKNVKCNWTVFSYLNVTCGQFGQMEKESVRWLFVKCYRIATEMPFNSYFCS